MGIVAGLNKFEFPHLLDYELKGGLAFTSDSYFEDLLENSNEILLKRH